MSEPKQLDAQFAVKETANSPLGQDCVLAENDVVSDTLGLVFDVLPTRLTGCNPVCTVQSSAAELPQFLESAASLSLRTKSDAEEAGTYLGRILTKGYVMAPCASGAFA